MNTKPGIYGKKLGCTQLFDDAGIVHRVTVIETGPATVVGKRTEEKDGYSALIIGLGERKEKHTNKPLAGVYKKAGVAAQEVLKELRAPADFVAGYEVGQTIALDGIFEAGQFVDVRGVSRGRGFSGVMRRHNFRGMGRSHGTHEYQRHGGSIGTNMTPGRTLPNVKMAGQHGNKTATVQNLTVFRVDSEKNLLLIEGGVPGAKNGLVLVRHAAKKKPKA